MTNISAHIEAVAQQIADIFTALDTDARFQGGEAHAALHDAPLGVTVEHRITVLLRDEHPQIEATAWFDGSATITHAVVTGTWGDDHVEQPVAAGSPLHRALQAYAEGVTL